VIDHPSVTNADKNTAGQVPASDSPPPVSPQPGFRVPLPKAAPYATYAIIGITVAFYILQVASVAVFGYPTSFTNMDWLELYGARINEFILAGQLWRLFTPALLHGSPPHIFFNMYALYSLGTGLEQHYGHRRFLLLYVLGAFAGNVASFLFTNALVSVGASTAVFGLIGAEGVFFYQNRKLFGAQARRAIGNIIFIAAINLFVIGSLSFIDNWGHIGGLLGGLMFSSLAGPVWEVRESLFGATLKDRRTVNDVLVAAGAVFFVRRAGLVGHGAVKIT
jgi:rhomboid protease GluP